MAPRPAKKAIAANPTPKEKAGDAKSKQTAPKTNTVLAVTVETEKLKQISAKTNVVEVAPNADTTWIETARGSG